jgi:RNA polymerase sigma-54 factor
MAYQGIQQVQKQAQTMVLAPQLRQSLKILQVQALELRALVQQELATNPTLEELPYDDISIEEPDPVEPSSEDEGGAGEERGEIGPATEASERLDFSDEFEILQRMGEDFREHWQESAGEQTYSQEAAEKRQYMLDSLTEDSSLQEELLAQARLLEDDPLVISAMEFVLGSLDDNGFITSSASDLALMAQVPLMKIQAAIALLRRMDPPGIGAANIQECLLLQLERMGKEQTLAARIIQKQWKLLLRRRIPEIARALDANSVAVQQAIELISKLDPAPARKYAVDTNQIIEADVEVKKNEYGEWTILLSNDHIPRLRLSPAYKQILAEGKIRGKDREYLQGLFRNSRFLVSAIEQRQQTIERITRELLTLQKDFFEFGRSHLKPLTMNQVAENVGVHETTVSRAIANKFIRTPHGLFEMKFFFTPGYQNQDGTEVSNKSIKNRIARVVESESPRKPLSDQKIVEILKEEGITIARRTVAKYRDELGILPTNLRRSYD